MNKLESEYHGGDGGPQRKLGEIMDGSIHAIHAKVPYAEPFVADKPELHELLPLSEYELQMSGKSEAEQIEHITQG